VSVVRRIAAEDQTVVVLEEDEYVSVLLFFGDKSTEDFDHPDEVVLLGASEAERFATALVEAVERTRAAA
jgi:hypothetical protein